MPTHGASLHAVRCFLQDGATPAVVRLYNTDETIRQHDAALGALLILARGGLDPLAEWECELIADGLRHAGAVWPTAGHAERWWNRRFDASAFPAYSDRRGGVEDIEVGADWSAIGTLIELLDEQLGPLCKMFHLHRPCFYRRDVSASVILHLGGIDDADALELSGRTWNLGGRARVEISAAISRMRLPWLDAFSSASDLLRRVQFVLVPDGRLSPGRLRLVE